jgi:hypothetical protein
MKIIVEMQKSLFPHKILIIFTLVLLIKNLKVRNNELEVFTASQKITF